MNNKTIIEFGFRHVRMNMKNDGDLGGCYPPQPSASADNTFFDLHNSSYHTLPHPINANCIN